MFLKKLDDFSIRLDDLFPLWMIFLLPLGLFGQTTTNSYEYLWEVVQNDTVSNQKKIQYLDVYYQKARAENNTLEQYRALEKKTYLVPFTDAAVLLHQMHPLVQNSSNDSIKGKFLNRSTVFYYKHRDFKNALYYAIESETFNEEINNLYNLNAVKITIGNIYLHTRYYDKAVAYFTEAKNYYQTQKEYNHQRSYILTLYCLSKTYWQLEDTAQLAAAIKESEQAVLQLKPKHQQLETAYLEYVKGGLAFLQKDYATAQNFFNKALPAIQQNGDFSNEHVIYLYLGKILWQQNQKEQAAVYFTKIDALFRDKEFLNYELREAYDYLMVYYQETNQQQLQFQATENLRMLNQQFEREQKSITTALHQGLDNKKLIDSQTQMQKRLSKSTIWISVLGGVLVLIAGYLFWKNYKKKKVEEKEKIIEQNETIETTDSKTLAVETVVIEDIEWTTNQMVEESGNAVAESVVETTTELPEPKQQEQKTARLSPTEQRLLDGLNTFEQEKGFLEPVGLDDLAKQLNTTRSTLSPFLSEYKNGFSTYINNLRIQQAVSDLKTDKELRKKTLNELAVIYGDLHPKTFASLFKVITGETPKKFVENLEKEEE